MAAESDAPACQPYTAEQYSAISILPQPSTFVVVSEALAENRRDFDGDQWIGNDWTISSEYDRASTTTVHAFDSVTWHADFSTKFPGAPSLKADASATKVISTGTGNEDNTALGFGYSIRNRGSDMPAVIGRAASTRSMSAVYIDRTLNMKYGVDVKTYARLWECVDPLESYVQGRVVYSPAMYRIVVTDELSTANGEGYHSKVAPYLLGNGTTNAKGEPNYLKPCGPAYHSEDITSPVVAGGHHTIESGKKQTFEKGQQLSYDATLRFLDVGGGHATGQSRDSAVTGASKVWTRWDNNTATQKYVCGYGASPNTTSNNVPIVVAVGWRVDGT